MNISVIVPLFNEAESLVELYDWIARVMRDNKFSYEVIFVDDGTTDNSWQVIQELKSKIDNPKSKNDDAVRGIRFRRNYGKSAALYCGFKAAQGDVVITMDADLQDSPDEIPELYRMITEEGYDLVSGWKKKRYDNALTKNLPSKLFNATARWVTGIHLHDMNCGLKAYRNEVVKNIEVFSEMHRYIPFLAKNAGFTKIGEKVVQHRKREHESVVPLHFREKAHALLRLGGQYDVLDWLYRGSGSRRYEMVRLSSPSTSYAGRCQSLFPHSYTDDDPRLHALLSRLPRRTHHPQLAVSQRLFDTRTITVTSDPATP